MLVALLDTFYSPMHAGERAPWWWYPLDSTLSSKRLVRMFGEDILCINSCPLIVSRADEHGVPNPQYVEFLLRRLDAQGPISTLLVCGAVAKATFRLSRYKTYAKIVIMPHPAWRAWTYALEKHYRDLV
jgi:hypothetical protein